MGVACRVESGIRIGQSAAADAHAAVAELHEAIAGPEDALVVVFCSDDHDLSAVEDAVRERFGDRLVIGATSAGEIGPRGYLERSISGASFPADHFTAAVRVLDGLDRFDPAGVRTAVSDLVAELGAAAPWAHRVHQFALDLIDGQSTREEPVAHAVQAALGAIPLVGGSSAGDRARRDTPVYAAGRFRRDAAVLALVATDLPFRLFSTHHFVTGDRRAVVTRADPARRVVQEIDGRPAATTYAQLAGIERDELTADRTALAPVVVRIGGLDFVRSVMTVHDDDSLTFHCAIDEGIVLRPATPRDLLGDLARTFDRLRDELGPLAGVLAFDCIQRTVEVTTTGIRDEVGDLLSGHRAVGFATFGEQFRGLHVNQTLTGVAFGAGAR